MKQRTFRAIFVLIPCLSCSIIPTAIFGVTIGEWGSSWFWGRVFGFAWYLSQNMLGPGFWQLSAAIGVFVWPPIVAYLLFLGSGTLYRNTNNGVHFYCLIGLLMISAVILPAHVILAEWKPGTVPADFNALISAY